MESYTHETDWLDREVVCWTRMQAEAGQHLHDIVARKEAERRSGGGIFFWGVGNAPARAAVVLAKLGSVVDVYFSVMKSKPKAGDVAPSAVLVWRRYIDHEGIERALPGNVLVRSRSHTNCGPKRAHYALVCRSEHALELSDHGPFNPTAYRNVSNKGAPIGASQVTALLWRNGASFGAGEYRVAFRAHLEGSYWVRLTDPVLLTEPKEQRFKETLAHARALTSDRWLEVVARLRDWDSPPKSVQRAPQLF